MSRRIAIITGGGSGLGRETALALARRGYGIVLAGRRADLLDAVAAEVAAHGAEAIAVRTDVTDESSVCALFARALERFGRVDLLFNNAGQGTLIPIEDMTLAEWHRVVDTNVTGAFLCLREAFRVMKAQQPQGGRIINNGSLSAHVPRPESIAYTASKHAMTGITRTALLEGRRHGIAVGQIDVGNAASDLANVLASGAKQADGSLKIEPMMSAQTVGETVAYMDSLPLEANIPFLTVMATHMPFIGRG